VNTSAVIEVRGVCKAFSSAPAVDDVSFEIPIGQSTAIIGPNGAGKSTLFGTIAGEHRPNEGTVHFNGTDVTRWSPGRRCRSGLARTFQVASFFPTLSVRENLQISWSARHSRLSPFDRFASTSREREDRVDTVLELLNLANLASAESHALSQGDRKRLELAMALVQNPGVLLLDEPTAGMSNEDIETTINLLKYVKAGDAQLTIVLTAHDMDVVFAICDRVILMGQGKLLVDGTPAEVENHPTTKKLYLGT
jgi:branched-chain amino acid transport system ATP-binding protein